jgi:hypothetical protein
MILLFALLASGACLLLVLVLNALAAWNHWTDATERRCRRLRRGTAASGPSVRQIQAS